jgi:hypothetical protein
MIIPNGGTEEIGAPKACMNIILYILHQAQVPTLSPVCLLDYELIQHEKSLILLTFTLKREAEFVS